MREARQTNKDPFYKVEQVPLQTVDGYAISYLGNQRVDNKEILGICTDEYSYRPSGYREKHACKKIGDHSATPDT